MSAAARNRKTASGRLSNCKGPPLLRGDPSIQLQTEMAPAVPRSSTYPRCLVVFELRHIFHGVLGRATQDRVIWIPLAFRRGRHRGGRRTIPHRGTGCALGSRGRANWLIDEF